MSKGFLSGSMVNLTIKKTITTIKNRKLNFLRYEVGIFIYIWRMFADI